MSDVPSLLELQELRQQVAAAEREKELRENYGVHFYHPHWKQHRFHEMGHVTGRYCRFGNRTGKTVCGSAEDVAWLIGGRVWYEHELTILNGKSEIVTRFDGKPGHPLVTKGIPQRPVKGLLVVADWDKAKEIFTNRNGSYEMWGELFQLIPRELVKNIHLSRGGHVDMITVGRLTRFGGGESIIYVDTVESFKHAWRSAESSDFDFIHYDEPPPHAMFIANKRGLADRNGKFWINATPVEEQWVNDEFTPPGKNTRSVVPVGIEFNKTERGGNRFIITASIYDNPFMSAAGRDEFEASLTAEEKECRLHGLPMNMAGLIYKQFVYDEHVLTEVPKGWDDYHLPPKDYTVRVAWDVHDAIPQAILLVATAPTGESFVYDEIWMDKLISPNAELLKEKLKGRFCAEYLIDPKAVIESPVTGESVLETLQAFDLWFEKGSKDMTLGISKTREKLLERRNGKPTLWFVPTVTQTLWEIARYCYNPKTQKPIDKDDHMMENLRRLILTELSYIEVPKDDEHIVQRNVAVGFAEDRVTDFNPRSLDV